MSVEEMNMAERAFVATAPPLRRPTQDSEMGLEELAGVPVVCPVTQRVIIVSPYPSEIYELLRALSEGCFDVLVFHHLEQGIRNAQAADLLIFDCTFYRQIEDAAAIQSLMEKTGDVPSLLLVNESVLAGLDQSLMNHELLVWPARPGEILYHAQRIIRNQGERSSSLSLVMGHSPAVFKDLWIDRNKMAVYRNGTQIELTKTEYELFVKLLENEGAVMSREELLSEVWDTTFLGGSNIVDVHIKSLRKKLGDRAVDSIYIATVRGVGYRLAD
ncbi:winged helix-turn-helix transcriptional regulator [Paenibacillus aceti]|uniref:winged helix-turn-helix transcriptional regulator n=1 Tax=Paenibacillus aceti TaxID=1820010 RepID=UPI001F090DEA|nr:response regulator transcription factor [Paenibacillus aceti]